MMSHFKYMGLYIFVRGIPVWNEQTYLLLTSNDVMFQISHWKSIKQSDILHRFNVRLDTFFNNNKDL